MSLASPPVYGDPALRSKVIDALLSPLDPPQETRIVHLQGETGSGKSFLLDTLRQHSRLRGHQVLWIEPANPGPLAGPMEFLEALADALRRDRPLPAAQRIRQEMNDVLERERQTTRGGNSLPGMGSSGSSKLGSIWEIGSAPEGDTLADGFLGCLPSHRAEWFLTVIVLDDWAAYSLSIREWIREHLLPRARRQRNRWHFRLLLTDSMPWAARCFAENWPVWSDQVREFALLPLEKPEVETWCRDAGVDAAHAETIYRQTGGWPGRIGKKLEEPGTRQMLSVPADLQWCVPFFQKRSDLEKKWLAAVVLLEECQASLLDFCLERHSGRMILKWLAEQKEIPTQRSWEEDSIVLDRAWQNQLRQFYRRFHPEFLEPYEKRLAVFRAVHEMVPDRHERQFLLRLAGLRHFNEELLARLYPGEEPYFATSFSQYRRQLQSKGEVFCLAPDLGKDLHQYALWLNPLSTAETLGRARQIWQEVTQQSLAQRSALQTEMAKLQESLREKQTSLARLEQQCQPGQVAHSSRSRPRSNRSWNSMMFRITLDVVGVALLYLGILFRSDLFLPLVLSGFTCIIVSFLPSSILPFGKSATSTHLPPRPDPRRQTHTHPLKTPPVAWALRRQALQASIENLETQVRHLALRIREIDRKLSLPLV